MTLKGWKLILNRLSFVPQRYILGICGMLALCISFSMRISLSMTLTQMVVKKASVEHIIGETCPDPTLSIDANTSSTQDIGQYTIRDRYDWSEATQGLLLSAFFYGYAITHIPGGLLADKFGGKWSCGLGILTSTVGTLLAPWSVKVGGAVGLFITRVIVGMGQGPVTPSLVLLLARWVPLTERSRFGAVIFGGGQIGNVIGPIISGYIMTDGGDWASVFYVFGVMGFVWFIFWSVLCYSTPNTHPYISDEERSYLNKNIAASGLYKKLDPVPFKALLTSRPFWILVLSVLANAFGIIAMTTDLPKYFSDVLKFNIKETGFMTASPYLAMYASSLVFASICDLCIKKGWHSVTTGRKIYMTLSSSFPALFLILASYSGCNRVEAVSLFIAAMAFMGAFYCSAKINAMDIAPNYAGTCSAFVNGFAAISGIIAPYVIGLTTPDQTVAQWRYAFWMIFAMLIFTNILYLIWGSGEQQWWDDVDKYGYPEGWKHGPFKTNHVPTKEVVDPQQELKCSA